MMTPIVDEHVVMQPPDDSPKEDGRPILYKDYPAYAGAEFPNDLLDQPVLDVTVEGLRVTAEIWEENGSFDYRSTVRSPDGSVNFQSNRCSSPVLAVQIGNAALVGLRIVSFSKSPPSPHSIATARHLRDKGETRLVTLREVLAAIAYESVRMSPYAVPVDLDTVLRQAHALLKDTGFAPPFSHDPAFLLRELTYDQLRDTLERLKEITEFGRWNITKWEQDQGYLDPTDPNRPVKFGVAGRGLKSPKADHDFVDLDAHISNTARLVWAQAKAT